MHNIYEVWKREPGSLFVLKSVVYTKTVGVEVDVTFTSGSAVFHVKRAVYFVQQSNTFSNHTPAFVQRIIQAQTKRWA